MGSELTLRTFCHENGHMICDFPDLYDYGGQSAGVGNYCLMCYGGNDKNPVQVCAYLKNEAGWASKVTAITPGLTASLPAAKNEFYLYSKNANEYFLIENRQKTGRDTFLPDAGLAIWHVDEQKNGNEEEQMTPSQHYECSLEQADNRFDLEKDANGGDNADLFRSPYKTEFSDSTSPAGKWWDGSNSGLKIAQISAVGATMTFTVPGSAWLEKKQITGLWMINQERNAAAYVDGLGWRKIAPESDSVFLGMLALLSAAKERKFPVNLRLENNVIQEIYVF
jgi:hypothetical protein